MYIGLYSPYDDIPGDVMHPKTCSKAYIDILMMIQKLGIFLWNLVSVGQKRKKEMVSKKILVLQ